jgi:2-dehydro-3-deoxyphosphooctonate aldolase (KDO 8-P synthase)
MSEMTLIAGPCVIEDEGMVLEMAKELKRQLSGLPVRFYFKASFDKANRTSIEGFRGPGLSEGLRILSRVKAETGLLLCTDFHSPEQADQVARVVDFVQIPAFLCRQTDLIVAGAEAALEHGRRLNIKKGQFLAPWDAKNIIEKVRATAERYFKNEPGKWTSGTTPAEDWFCITERGTSFGYNTLVVDMISFQCIQSSGVPVIFDATHSVQVPGGASGQKSTGGKPEYLESLSRAAMAAGADGLFVECHPDPKKAKSDGPNSMPLQYVGQFVKQLLEIRRTVGSMPKFLTKPSS